MAKLRSNLGPRIRCNTSETHCKQAEQVSVHSGKPRPCTTATFKEASRAEYEVQGARWCSSKSLGLDFAGGPVVENPPANAGDTRLIPGPGRFHMSLGNYAHVPQLLKPLL